ncbi:MAG: Nudix family hydrolase [Burkholderiales bacterium]|nr:Nudix family hydrolase [Burkholderiales bacterium]
MSRTAGLVEVAAAVIQRPDGSFLLGRRPPGKVFAGYWEFPGGKVEPGEGVAQALARELREELGIEVQRAYPWIVQRFVYPHAHVQLHFHRVVQWRGEPRPHEEQLLAWTSVDDMRLAPILPANGPVLKALALPHEIAITCASELGVPAQLEKLDAALAAGVRLVMIRERQLPDVQWRAFAAAVIEHTRGCAARAIVNDTPARASMLAADAIHMNGAELMQAARRPDAILCGASCHDAAQLARAQALELDYAIVGPVLPTPSHPQAPGIGWERFAQLIEGSTLPVFAIGGMQRRHLERAWECGAHGVAMMRAPWAGQDATPITRRP